MIPFELLDRPEFKDARIDADYYIDKLQKRITQSIDKTYKFERVKVQPVTSVVGRSKVLCAICGGQYLANNKYAHDKTKKHIKATTI